MGRAEECVLPGKMAGVPSPLKQSDHEDSCPSHALHAWRYFFPSAKAFYDVLDSPWLGRVDHLRQR